MLRMVPLPVPGRDNLDQRRFFDCIKQTSIGAGFGRQGSLCRRRGPGERQAGVDVVSMEHIAKRFGELTAIHDASVSIRAGEIHALVGENGAGKTTLMNILYGLLPRDGGEILLRGKPVEFGGPAEAIRAGIGMVHQHFKLAPSFTVAENIILGSEPLSSFDRIDRAAAERQTADLSHNSGSISIRAPSSASFPSGSGSASRSSRPSIATPRSSSSTSRPRC